MVGAAAVLFAREGAKLVLANRSMASREGTHELLRKEGFDAECLTADISNEDDCTALVSTAVGPTATLASSSIFGKVNQSARIF
jgi:NAD(P)-dependent dehydrogenase (short-subunit alcohol dehydrogenase family)